MLFSLEQQSDGLQKLYLEATEGLTAETLEAAMDSQLEKPENEIDADFVENCIRLMGQLEVADTTQKISLQDRKRRPYLRRVLIAAVLAVLLIVSAALSLTAAPKVDTIYSPRAAYRQGALECKLTNEYQYTGACLASQTPFGKKLEALGFRNLALPESLIVHGDIHSSEFHYRQTKVGADVQFPIAHENAEPQIQISIKQDVRADSSLSVARYYNEEIKAYKEVWVQGIPIHVAEFKSGTVLLYCIGADIYEIKTSFQVNDAVEWIAALN